MLAGGLTVAGGVMTVMTAGAALPVLVAVRPQRSLATTDCVLIKILILIEYQVI